MKTAWREIVKSHSRRTGTKPIQKVDFPALLSDLWKRISKVLIKNCFQATGLYLLNATKPLKKLLPIQKLDDNSDAETPFSELKKSIIATIFPPQPDAISSDVQSRKKKRIPQGVVLTNNVCKAEDRPKAASKTAHTS